MSPHLPNLNFHLPVCLCRSLWLLLLLTVRLEAAECVAEAFARNLRHDLRQMLYEAADLEFAGAAEHVEPDTADQRQTAHCRRDSAGDVNQAQPRPLANAALLELAPAPRRAVLRSVDQYLDGFVTHFAASLHDAGFMVEGKPPSSWLAARLRLRLRFRCHYFGHRGQSFIAAMYHQPTTQIIINLDTIVDCPYSFIDALEHELWHHLLPIPAERQLADNLWWEGSTEAISELWAYYLHRRLRLPGMIRRSVEYPVDTAFVSWMLAVDRAATVAYLAGEISRCDLVRAIEEGCLEYGAAVAATVRNSVHLDSRRQRRIETLLEKWRWRGSDGAAVSVAHLLVDGIASPPAVNQALIKQRQFLMDFIQAWSVTLLQDLQLQLPRQRPQQLPQLPPALRDNLAWVREYIADPYYQLSNR